MLKIAVCDDEMFFREEMRKLIAEYCSEKNIEYEIELFSSGENFVLLGVEMSRFDIVYLDINMKGLDGIETAEKLRKWCKETFIVFVTAYINYTLEGYKVEAIRYVLKNSQSLKGNIRESLDAILEKINKNTYVYEFPFREGRKKLVSEQIGYIESNLHLLRFLVFVQGEEKRYTLTAKLDDIEKLLEKSDFIRIHKSFLVNMKFIKEISAYQVSLWNGVKLPIARPRYQNVKEQFLIYEGEF